MNNHELQPLQVYYDRAQAILNITDREDNYDSMIKMANELFNDLYTNYIQRKVAVLSSFVDHVKSNLNISDIHGLRNILLVLKEQIIEFSGILLRWNYIDDVYGTYLKQVHDIIFESVSEMFWLVNCQNLNVLEQLYIDNLSLFQSRLSFIGLL